MDFQRRTSSIGLTLNVKKCAIIGLNRVSRKIWEGTDFAKSFLEPSMETANLLFSEGLNTYLGQQRKTIQILSQRFLLMSGHEAFFLFKNCLTVPKWLYVLRSSPCFESIDLQLHDTLQREILSTFVTCPRTCLGRRPRFRFTGGGVGVECVQSLTWHPVLS